MAEAYKLTAGQRVANKYFLMMTNHGWGAEYRHVLSVRGRASGELRSTPVDVMQNGENRWLVAPYGAVNWVRNLRAADGQLTLRRGQNIERLVAREISAEDAVPVIRRYIGSVPVTSHYWDVTADSTDQQIATDGVHHPVFRLSSADL